MTVHLHNNHNAAATSSPPFCSHGLLLLNAVNWNRITNTEELTALRARLHHDDVDHLMTLTHRAGGPALPGPFSGFDSPLTTHLWLRDLNSGTLTEVAFIGVQWFVPPETLPLFGAFDLLDRMVLYESDDTVALAARCSMLGHRIIESFPDLPSLAASQR